MYNMSNCPYTPPDLRFAKLDSNLYAVENLVHKTRRLGNPATLGQKQLISSEIDITRQIFIQLT